MTSVHAVVNVWILTILFIAFYSRWRGLRPAGWFTTTYRGPAAVSADRFRIPWLFGRIGIHPVRHLPEFQLLLLPLKGKNSLSTEVKLKNENLKIDSDSRPPKSSSRHPLFQWTIESSRRPPSVWTVPKSESKATRPGNKTAILMAKIFFFF